MSRSRGDRAIAPGNLSSSMRENYGELGVSEYYKKIGSTYRNPHFPGIRLCLFLWLNRWWHMENCNINRNDILVFDMACGFGEVTLAFVEWWRTGSEVYKSLGEVGNAPTSTPRRKSPATPTPLSPDFHPLIFAADPYTAAAYQDRTSLTCAPMSFKDISEGALPPLASGASSAPGLQESELPDGSRPSPQLVIEMVICSFALHLVENPSQLFSLLWELSLKSRWLVVLAPHKKPEIKDGWGWQKWNIQSWEACQMVDNTGELLNDRVHCRVYRSLNV